MDFEKLLDKLNALDPYKLSILRQQLDEYNERKTLALVFRSLLIFFGMIVFLLTR